jgi:hypothetical protein
LSGVNNGQNGRRDGKVLPLLAAPKLHLELQNIPKSNAHLGMH